MVRENVCVRLLKVTGLMQFQFVSLLNGKRKLELIVFDAVNYRIAARSCFSWLDTDWFLFFCGGFGSITELVQIGSHKLTESGHTNVH